MTAVSAVLPEVHLDVRQGSGRSASYTLDHVDFLIGAVPGCDLRVPGADLPPVLCLITRLPGGAKLRKLAPTQVLLVNGETATNADLADGDRITLGAIDIFVRIQDAAETLATPTTSESTASSKLALQKQVQALRAQVVRFNEERATFAAEQQKQQDDGHARQQQLDEQSAELEREKTYWYQRREEIRKEIDQLAAAPVTQEAGDRVDASAPNAELQAKLAEIEQERQQLATQRQELADIRKQLYDRYQERRDRLAGLQDAVDKAATKVQERKRLVDAESQELAQQRAQQAQRLAEIEKRSLETAAQAQRLEQERRLIQDSRAEVQADVAAKLADLRVREEKSAAQQRDVAAKLKQYEADVVRLDRRQGELEQREQQVQAKSAHVEEKLQQLQHDSAELETQAGQLDEWRSKLALENDRLAQQKKEQDAVATQLAQRAALLEGQQATLAALRTRLERMRDDVRRQEQQLEEQRTRQESVEAELEQQTQAVLQLKTELDNEEKLREQERQQLSERAATLDAAVAQLKQARQQLAGDETRIRQRAGDLDERQATLADQEGVLEGRLNQLAEAQQRLDAERQALRERTLAQTQAEQAREALQEQLRRRSEELAARQKALNEQIQDYQTKAAALDGQRGQLDQAHQQALAQVEAERQQVQQQSAALEYRAQELREIDNKQQAQQRQLQEMGRVLAEQQQALAQQQEDNQRAWQQKQADDAEARSEFDVLRKEAKRVVQLLPDVELRAGTALDRVTHAREQLRDHVAEIHAYVRQCQEELEAARTTLQTDVLALGQKEQALRRGQDEQRLAMVAFRQQLIDWQGQISELKRQLARGETKLERRRSEMDDKGRELDAAAERLAQQADALGQQQHEVAQKRDELDRHLVDMRQWYRQKLRDLAGIPLAVVAEDEASSSAAEMPITDGVDQGAIMPTSRDILSITEPMDAGDLQLGATLRDLQLIDEDTLTALLMEARRQRRSLRQVLLAGGVVTVYQLALIEAGNVAGLMVGPVRVIDRLRTTAHEVVYRVFDPRRGREAVLRHLSTEALRDAGHAADFRARFTQALGADAHRAETYEVLELVDRPAVLQEWLTGLPASDWPPLAAAPGVCFRLVTQAALGLATAHKAGQVHGHLDDAALLLTGAGMVKICGLGEPTWLIGKMTQETAGPQHDLQALGRIAAGWCLPDGVRKGAKTKPLPDALAAVLQRLAAGAYRSAAVLLDDLDRAGSDVPPNAEAWDRLLKYVREHETPEALLRLSA